MNEETNNNKKLDNYLYHNDCNVATKLEIFYSIVARHLERKVDILLGFFWYNELCSYCYISQPIRFYNFIENQDNIK